MATQIEELNREESTSSDGQHEDHIRSKGPSMATRIEEVAEREGWEPVPPGHPHRAAFEEKMRELGIRPASRWEPRQDRKLFQRPGWRDWIRSRLGL